MHTISTELFQDTLAGQEQEKEEYLFCQKENRMPVQTQENKEAGF